MERDHNSIGYQSIVRRQNVRGLFSKRRNQRSCISNTVTIPQRPSRLLDSGMANHLFMEQWLQENRVDRQGTLQGAQKVGKRVRLITLGIM